MRKGKEKRKKRRKKMSLKSSTTIRPILSIAKIRTSRNQKLLIFQKTWTWMTKKQRITLTKLQLMSLGKCQTLKMRLMTRRRTWMKTSKARMTQKKRNQGTKKLNPEWISMKRLMIKRLSSRKAILTRTRRAKFDDNQTDTEHSKDQ